MKKLKLISMLTTCVFLIGQSVMAQASQGGENEKIKRAITQFVKGGDAQDVASLDKVMHPGFRVVVNNAFGSNKIDIMTKEAYLGLMKEGQIGGTPRSIQILSLETIDNIATAKVKLESDKLRFTSLYSFVRTPDQQWLLINDMPHIEAK